MSELVLQKIITQITFQTKRIQNKAHDIVKQEQGDESVIIDFSKDFSDTYFMLLNVIENHFETGEKLSLSQNTKSSNVNGLHLINREKVTAYFAIALYVIKIGIEIAIINDDRRKILLTNINDVLTSFRKFVNYRDPTAETALCRLSIYADVWRASNAILVMEMNAKFAYLHRIRREVITNPIDSNMNEAIIKVSQQYNACFWMYSRSVVRSWELKLILVNHYVKYLLSFIAVGQPAHEIIKDTSGGNWKLCCGFMKELMIDNRVDEELKANWNKLSAIMANIFETTV